MIWGLLEEKDNCKVSYIFILEEFIADAWFVLVLF